MLYSACVNGNINIIDRLIREGVDINYDYNGIKPLLVALINGKSNVALLLLDQPNIIPYGITSTSIKYPGGSPLHIASSKGFKDVIIKLIRLGADINQVDNNGNTPLHLAYNADIAQLLLDYGANKYITNRMGQTPLDIAYKRGNAKMIEVIDNHNDLEIKEPDEDYYTVPY